MKQRIAPLAGLGIVYVSLSTPAFAYLDGATGSMLLQAAIGGVASVMVFGRHYIAKVKSFFSRGSSKAGPNSDT